MKLSYVHYINRQGEAKLCTHIETYFSVLSHPQCQSQAVVCVSPLKVLPRFYNFKKETWLIPHFRSKRTLNDLIPTCTRSSYITQYVVSYTCCLLSYLTWFQTIKNFASSTIASSPFLLVHQMILICYQLLSYLSEK